MQSVPAFFQLRSWGTERRMLATLDDLERSPYGTRTSLEREDLPAEHRHIYDDIAGSRGGVQPNFKALLNNPLATARMAALGGMSGLKRPCLPGSKCLPFWPRHGNSTAIMSGRPTCPRRGTLGWMKTINAIRERRAPQGLAPEDALIVQFTLELLRQHRITDATYQAVQHRLGDAGVIDLLILIGYYGSLSHTLSALEVMPPVSSAL